MNLKINQFNYPLPEHLIANKPAEPRDHSRLMLVNRQTKEITHHHFYHLPELLPPNAVLVLNQTKVFPARLYGHKQSGGKVEILLLGHPRGGDFKHPGGDPVWQGISKPGLKPGQQIVFHQLKATVLAKEPEGLTTFKFNIGGKEFFEIIDKIGHTPIPPYIPSNTPESKLRSQYQTVYANSAGSAAAPTAGLHFTQNLLDQLTAKGIQIEKVTLHVGLGTFKNPTPEQIESGTLHQEWFEISSPVADRLNQAKRAGRPIVAVGTTSLRTLESAANDSGDLVPQTGFTNIFIKPGYRFKFVDHLITNFHLPQTSLLMLIAALTEENFTTFSNSFIGQAYQTAVNQNYRFFSFGDAMLIK